MKGGQVFVLLMDRLLRLFAFGDVQHVKADAFAVRHQVQHLLVPDVVDLDFAHVLAAVLAVELPLDGGQPN